MSSRDLLGRVLQIAVHLDEPAAARVEVEGLDRGLLAVVAGEADDADARVARTRLAQELGRAVARSVVDEEELEGRADPLHRADDARRERLDVALLVEDGDDDAVGDCDRSRVDAPALSEHVFGGDSPGAPQRVARFAAAVADP